MKERRFRLIYKGAVQGVGFRPTVYKLAKELYLKGNVKNSPSGATVEIEGDERQIEKFIDSLPSNLPEIARISSLSKKEIQIKNEDGFKIISSQKGKRKDALTSFDSKICDDCKKEMEDKKNRRFHYPFTNCTNCGPRFTIVSSFPYDRERTSMACFPMCEECLKEYKDPTNRRYHSEATCCPECGPLLTLFDKNGKTIASGYEAIERARKILENGKIIAIKGIGGFQLAADAQNEKSIRNLRKRKGRETKPFAVMVKDLKVAKKWIALSDEDSRLLQSPRAPILIGRLRKKDVRKSIAPNLKDIGVFIPTTPLHIELFRNARYDSLIMTSGKLSDEPIAISNREALKRLSGIADYFLVHNRDILRRLDDSVFKSSVDKPFALRRSRGYVPESIKLNFCSKNTILSTGAFLQNSGCILKKDEAFLTPHIGDLDSSSSRDFLYESITSFKKFLDVDFDAVAVDLSKDYPSTILGEKMAEESKAKIVRVQHHLAHLASVCAEHQKFPIKKNEKVYGIIFDGTGLGTDMTSWGGEFIELNSDLEWKRVSHLKTFQLIGNEKAVREPYRVALSLLKDEGLEEIAFTIFSKKVSRKFLKDLCETENWELSSGVGRLFESAGALLNLTMTNGYEGESAMIFESLAEEYIGNVEIWKDVKIEDDNLFPTSKFFASFAKRSLTEDNLSKLSLEFHINFSRITVEIAKRIFDKNKIVCLSGGCFYNRILRSEIKRGLEQNGFIPLLNYNIPSGDGGISLGQAALAGRSLLLQKDLREIKE